MKKISKSDLRGLTERFPVMGSEVQRGVVGGGYVDHSSPGYFYLGDGYGGYIGYYNSVYGYGEHEVIPTHVFL